jgi:hypothetical protein
LAGRIEAANWVNVKGSQTQTLLGTFNFTGSPVRVSASF